MGGLRRAIFDFLLRCAGVFSGGISGGSPAILPVPALLVGIAMGGGKSSLTKEENRLILLCAIGGSSSKHHEVYAMCSSALIVYG